MQTPTLRDLPDDARELIAEVRGLVLSGLSYADAAEWTCGIFSAATVEALCTRTRAFLHSRGYRATGLSAAYPVPLPDEIARRAAAIKDAHAARIEAARLAREIQTEGYHPETWWYMPCLRYRRKPRSPRQVAVFGVPAVRRRNRR